MYYKIRLTLLLIISVCSLKLGLSDDWPMEAHDAQATYCTSEDIELPVTEIWNSSAAFDLPAAGSVSPPAVHHGVVYLGTNDGKVYALEAKTGKLIWCSEVGGVYEGSPVVSDNIVIVSFKDSKIGPTGRVYGLDALSGQVLWQFDLRTIHTTCSWGSPILYNGIVYLITAAHIVALDATTGRLLWFNYAGTKGEDAPPGTQAARALSGYPAGELAVDEGIVFIGPFLAKIYAFDAQTGLRLWLYRTGAIKTFAFAGSIRTSGICGCGKPLAFNGMVYGGAGDNVIYALEGRTGRLIWTFQEKGFPCGFSLSDGKIYAPSADGNIYVLHPTTGQLLHTLSLGPDNPIFSAILSKGFIWVRRQKSGQKPMWLTVLDKTTGRVLWEYEEPILSDPVIAGQIVYVESALQNNSWSIHLFALAPARRAFKLGIPAPRISNKIQRLDNQVTWDWANRKGFNEVISLPIAWQNIIEDYQSTIPHWQKIAKENKLPLYLSLDWLNETRSRLALPQHLAGKTFDDPQVRAEFKKTCIELARKFKPAYFNLGREANFYAFYKPKDFHNFLSLYFETYDAIKALLPQTKVFFSFNYELLQGLLPKALTPKEIAAKRPKTDALGRPLMYPAPTTQPQWQLLKSAESKLDLIGISTYPASISNEPKELAADYYLCLKKITKKPILISELGIPYDVKNPGSQTQYLKRFFQLIYWLDAEAVVYASLHDPERNIARQLPDWHKNIGLIDTKGNPKPAFAFWLKAKQWKLVPTSYPFALSTIQ